MNITNFKKMNKFAKKNRTVLNVAMVILTIAALSIPGLNTGPLSSVVSGAVTVVIAVILFRVMLKVAIKK